MSSNWREKQEARRAELHDLIGHVVTANVYCNGKTSLEKCIIFGTSHTPRSHEPRVQLIRMQSPDWREDFIKTEFGNVHIGFNEFDIDSVVEIGPHIREVDAEISLRYAMRESKRAREEAERDEKRALALLEAMKQLRAAGYDVVLRPPESV